MLNFVGIEQLIDHLKDIFFKKLRNTINNFFPRQAETKTSNLQPTKINVLQRQFSFNLKTS